MDSRFRKIAKTQNKILQQREGIELINSKISNQQVQEVSVIISQEEAELLKKAFPNVMRSKVGINIMLHKEQSRDEYYLFINIKNFQAYTQEHQTYKDQFKTYLENINKAKPSKTKANKIIATSQNIEKNSAPQLITNSNNVSHTSDPDSQKSESIPVSTFLNDCLLTYPIPQPQSPIITKPKRSDQMDDQTLIRDWLATHPIHQHQQLNSPVPDNADTISSQRPIAEEEPVLTSTTKKRKRNPVNAAPHSILFQSNTRGCENAATSPNQADSEADSVNEEFEGFIFITSRTTTKNK